MNFRPLFLIILSALLLESCGLKGPLVMPSSNAKLVAENPSTPSICTLLCIDSHSKADTK